MFNDMCESQYTAVLAMCVTNRDTTRRDERERFYRRAIIGLAFFPKLSKSSVCILRNIFKYDRL